MNSNAKVFSLVAMVVMTLLLMHQLPTFSINGTATRPVDLLSDLRPQADEPEPLTASRPPLPKKAFTPYRPKGVVMIEDYSDGKPGGMDHFYDMLLDTAACRQVSIAYFGDSFIEADITTCDLRELLQERFGGEGPGWVDCGGALAAARPTVRTRASLIAEHIVTQRPFTDSLQAISQKYYTPQTGASLTLAATTFRPHVARWQRATLFFRTASDLTISASSSAQRQAEATTFSASPQVQALTLRADTMTSLTLRFPKGAQRSQLLGVALDGEGRGVALDNFSIRGSAGHTIARIPLRTLHQLDSLRRYDLIIVQFGLNAAGSTTTEAQCLAYTKRMKKVVAHLREAFPEASILVNSVSDRVERTASGMQTMKGIERLVAAQRLMASECGVAFLSIFDCMGGRGSMTKYVSQGWAAKDYTHMNHKGGRQVAGEVYKSLMAGMENRRRAKEAAAE